MEVLYFAAQFSILSNLLHQKNLFEMQPQNNGEQFYFGAVLS